MNGRAAGLVNLLADAVVHGSKAVEGAHRGITARSFWWLKQVPGAAGPATAVEAVLSVHTSVVYGSIRGGARVLQSVAHVAMEASAKKG